MGSSSTLARFPISARGHLVSTLPTTDESLSFWHLVELASTDICTEQSLGLCGPLQKVQVTDLAIKPDAVDNGAFSLPTDCCLDSWFFSFDWSALSRISSSRFKNLTILRKSHHPSPNKLSLGSSPISSP